MQDRQAEGDILMPFCFVVAIDALQRLIKLADKKRHISGLPLEFDQPFMRAIAGIPKIYRRGRIVIHDSARLFRRDRNSLIRIVHDHLLAKGIDKMLQPPTDLYPEREAGGKLDRIPQQIPPQPAIGVDHQRILLSQLHIIKPDGLGVGLAIFFHRHELHKDAMIQEQQHPVIMRIALRRKKSFTGIVHVQIVDILPDQLPELLLVRRKGDAAMDIQLQRRPNLRQACSCP